MKKDKLPSLISIMILTLLTSILWVSLSVYRAFTTKPDVNVSDNISSPITPALNQVVIQKIESKQFFDSSQVPDNIVGVQSSPNPTAIPKVQVASPSATPTGP